MPIIEISALKGRTLDQRRALAKEITDSLVRVYGAAPETVSIIFRDMAQEEYAKAGVLYCDRGK
ncbi:MAG: 4-oxalocrotonate tautomerase [Firmicutes bacterium]|nr:4-oxalocrotonate tautomerase [Bacillota bacterium]